MAPGEQLGLVVHTALLVALPSARVVGPAEGAAADFGLVLEHAHVELVEPGLLPVHHSDAVPMGLVEHHEQRPKVGRLVDLDAITHAAR
ncbi:MAG TPA: hypothetical protein VEM59_04540 [Acidimicrobiia bacterium]|nr:hypothetical protein [Acidimicrobiia bacterium]